MGRASPRLPSTPQVVGQQFFFSSSFPTAPFPLLPTESTESGFATKVEGEDYPVVTESDFEDIEEE